MAERALALREEIRSYAANTKTRRPHYYIVVRERDALSAQVAAIEDNLAKTNEAYSRRVNECI